LRLEKVVIPSNISIIMKKYLLILITFILTTNLHGQYIRVLDEDNKPVPDVAVYDNTRSSLTYTSRTGRVAISAFSRAGAICFQHFAFDNLCLSPQEIQAMDNVVRLTRKVFVVDEFVVSASRWEQKADEVPNKITPVLKSVVQLHNPQTAADMLSLSGDVFIQKSQLGGGSPMIRGFATNRILIVVDGVRMNNAIYREGNIQNVISLDPSVIERTEVVFGPGATIYGSDAIGGVMDFHSKRALVSTGDNLFIKADVYTRYSTANNEKTGHFDINIGGKKLALLTGITYSDFGDLRMGKPQYDTYLRPEYVQRIDGRDSIFVNSDPQVQYFSGYNQIYTINKLRFRASDNFNLTISNHWSKLSDVPRYDRLIVYRSGKLRYGEWRYGPQEWLMTSAEAVWKGNGKIYDDIKLIAAHQFYRESRHDRALNKNDLNSQYERLNIFSLNLDIDKSLDKNQLIYYGLEYVMNDINSVADITNISTGVVTPAGTRYPNGSNIFSSYSVYGGYKNPVTGSFAINTGLRYNYVTLNSTIEDNSWYNFPFTEISIAGGALTGSAGIVMKLGSMTELTANASTGFRAPNLDDAGKVFESAPGVVVVPNPDLKPEYAWNIDAGITRNFGRVLHAEINGFFTWLDNAMVRRDFLFNGEDSIMYLDQLSKVEAVVNAGNAMVYGLQISLQANLIRDLKLRSTLNITEGKDQDGIPLRHVAPLFGSTHLTYERLRFKADLYSNYNGKKSFEKMAPSEAEKPYLYAADDNGNPFSPQWFTLNFKMSYNFSNWGVINAGVENIFDLGYRPYSSGIVAPGRNFVLSLRVTV
jgi:hemoglobin/transferrin/lactoferrin receptor protein